MKKIHSHKNPMLLGGGILIVISILLLFTTCDIGLGQIVNTEKPVINSAGDNPPGTFLQGKENKIALDVSNKLGFKIVEVWMDVDYIDAKTGQPASKRVDAQQDPDTGEWFVMLDTSDMEDGPIKGKVTAKDESGNTATTTEMVYNVKNTPPQIKLNMPLVDGEQWDDDKFLTDLKNTDPLTLGFDLMGLATDDYGIAEGYPKIMIWPAPDQDFSIELGADGMPLSANTRYSTWRELNVPNRRAGLTATKFSWPMMELIQDQAAPGGWRLPNKNDPSNKQNFLLQGTYRIRIVTKDLFGNENYYPNRTDTTRKPDKSPPLFIEINYKASNIPLVQFTSYPQYYNAVPDLEVYFSVGSQNPVSSITASIVNSNDPSVQNTLGGPYTLSNSITFVSANGALYRYKLTVPAAEAKLWPTKKIDGNAIFPTSGILFVKVQAVSSENTGPETFQNFIFDDKPPNVIVDRPVNLTNKVTEGNLNGGSYEIWYPDTPRPKWVTGSITVGGSVDDNLTLIKDIYYHIGKLNDDDLTSDRETIYTTDSNWKNTNIQYTDKEPGWSGSLYSWTYTFATFDNEYKTTTEGLNRTQAHTDLYYSFPNNIYSETTSPARKRFYLPFYVKVVDSANNYKIIHYKLSVDPLLDEPTVSITQPEVKKDINTGLPIIPIVGGTVRVSGYAEDNFWMHTVLIRVQKWGGNSAGTAIGGYPGGTTLDNNYYIPKTTPPTLPFYKDSSVSSYPRPMKADGTTPDIDGWFAAEKQGDSNNINWYALINQNLELDPPTGENTVKVIVEVVAIDCAQSDTTHNTVNTIGPVEKLELKFSKDVPLFSNVQIKKSGLAERSYNEGIKASDVFQFSFDVEAINNINTLTVRVNGAATPITLINGTLNQPVENCQIISINPAPSGKNKRNVTFTIDSLKTTIPGLLATGYPYGKTGNLTLEITAVDATENRLSTTNTFVIGIDNFYPTAVINTLNIAADNPSAAKYYFVEGTAQDYPSNGANLVQGLDKVLIYFERANITYEDDERKVRGNGTYVRPNGIDANVSTDFITYPKVLYNEGPTSLGDTSPNKTDYTRFPKLNSGSPLTSPSAMVIDNPENGATLDLDGDGTYGEIWNGQSSAFKEIGARVDFRTGNNWIDGPYIVHYMILDQAGNATHYQNNIYLENKKPRITNINFGTDIDGNGSVSNTSNVQEYLYTNDEVISAPSNSATYGIKTLNNPYFRIRGNIFAVKFSVANGNGNKSATVTYVTQGAPISAASMERGRVYTIVNQGGGWSYTDFTKYGAPNNIEGTTFVATGPATVSPPPSGTQAGTIGTVSTYESRPDGSHRFPLSMASETDGTIFITNFSNIPDSEKDTNGDILSTKHNERLFILKVFDTTISNESSPDGWDQLADALLVKVDIDNKDGKAPSIEVLPFGYEYNVDPSATPPLNNPANYAAKVWKLLIDSDYNNYNKNIGMNRVDNADVKGGYVQYSYLTYPAINPTGTADISGKIKFLGKVEDNHRIASIWVKIDNYNGGTLFQIAQTNSDNQIIPVTNSAGDWVFTVLDNKNYQTLEYGHSLSWEFMWDSSKHSKVADSGVNITFEVRDAASSVHSSTASKAVNIVPYISEVVTSLSGTYYSPSVFNRSALGGYPVREGEIITIRGFNLNTDVKIGAASLTGTAVVSGAKGGISGTVPDVNSGPLVVTVNGVSSFNNDPRKEKRAPYNQEPNGVNNNILDNSRYIYVWNTGSLYSTNISQMSNPFMRMDNSANRYMSYGNYAAASSGRLRVRKNNTDYYIGDAFSNRMVYTTVGVGGSNTSFYALGTDLSSSANDNRGFQLGLSNAAGDSSIFNDGTAAGNNGANFGNLLITKTNDSSPERYKIPRIAVQPGSTTRGDNAAQDRIFISYYDDSTNSGIEVIYVNVGTTTVTTSPTTTVPAANGATGYRSFDATVKHKVTDATYKGSIYTAVGLLSNGFPVIAWYENATQKLMFSYNTATSSNVNWGSNAAIIADGKGTHVDMAVDASNNVHLAYYSDDGGLWYTYIPSSDVTNASRPTPRSVRVDTFLSPGTKLMINIRNGIPYISYAHASFPGTRHSIRVAWRVSDSANTADGTNEDDTFTGKWEVMTVPVRSEVIPNIDDFVCNGVPTASSWPTNALTGTSLTYSTANPSQTILVGFLTNSSYEGAVLRDNILTVPDILKKTP